MRIVMKISGEALKDDSNISEDSLKKVFTIVKQLCKRHEIILVCGGGNFWRGRNNLKINNIVSDHIGMLATAMNAIAINSYFNLNGINSNCYSAFEIPGIIKKDNVLDINKELKMGNVIILGGGLGIPNLSTDMTTVSKAVEYQADLILMAKNIDAIYNKDPKEKDAIKLKELTHEQLFNMSLKQGASSLMILDIEALAKLVKYKIPMFVYNPNLIKNIDDVIKGKIGTKVSS